MSQRLESLSFSFDGQRSRAEIYGLLSAARIKYAQAIRVTARPSLDDAEGIDAGSVIFHSTYDALSYNKWEGHLPTFYELPEVGPNEMVLPYPILLALAYFLDSAQTVCLNSWKFHTGNPDIDRAIVAWPNSLLWGLPSKMRFFFQLFEAYDGIPTEKPLLSNPRARAVQLLVVGKELLERQMRKIGKPTEGNLILPTS